MKRNLHPLLIAAFVLALVTNLGCTAPSASQGRAKDLSFSDVKVESDKRTGLLGGRHAAFEVSATVTNQAGDPVREDALPAITWDDGKASAKAVMEREELPSGETCSVSWSGELKVGEDGSVPTLAFGGDAEFDGLEVAESELNRQLRSLSEEFASEDAERQRQEEDEARKVEEDRAALEGCKGKTALEALGIAEEADYAPRFKDAFGVDVTSAVQQARKESEIGAAKVTEVSIKDAGWISDASVTFVLDYADPDAQAKRDAKANSDAADRALENPVGLTCAEAAGYAGQSSYQVHFFTVFREEITDVATDSSGLYAASQGRVRVCESETGRDEVGLAVVNIVLDDPVAIRPEDDAGLRTLLSDGTAEEGSLREFAKEYQGEIIEFDAFCSGNKKLSRYYSIFFFAPRNEGADTRRLFAMNKYGDGELKWVRRDDHESEGPPTFPVSKNVHIVARVIGFDDEAGAVGLEPVMTWLIDE